MRYALDVQYKGKNYAGSQIQFGGKCKENPQGIQVESTIQGEIEKALSTLIIGGKSAKNKDRQVKTIFSGRTDKGVNALGQVIHFDYDKDIVASDFIYHMNEILPDDISVNNLRIVPNGFHAQKSAKSRYYKYEFINRRYKQAFDGDIPRVKFKINIERMQKALNYLLGEHNFSSFKSSGTLNPSKVCILTRAEVKKQGDRVFIHIEGNRFLYNMVRTIVGTLLEIEGHNLPAEHMKEVLEACDRRKAGQTVSPYGLTLMRVDYSHVNCES
ncbi:tRNA pseudouridine(38-40) synthase TruA [bacterium]|nr:tRNA pseudouridine(38-40) synthase TruA [bacterium]